MSDNNRTPNRSLGSIFDDFWGSGKVPQRPSKPAATNPAANLGKKLSATPERTAQIHNIITDIEKSIQQDFSSLPDPKANLNLDDQPETQTAAASPATETAAEAVVQEPETDPMEDLNALVGLTDLKKDVEELISLVKMQKMRKDQGLKSIPVSLHLVFSGNPGTGKTTVARILARLYRQIGVLSKGQLVEVDRSGLVAGFVGQTATKTQEKIKEAMGGILFIDEAYTLAKEAGNDFGQEAIDTILKAMEDHRDEFVVIVAGYPDLMERFINSNPGLKSRFNKYLYFKDYTKEELFAIFEGFLKKYEYTLAEDAKDSVLALIETMEAEKDENFANAREVRNMFEKIVTRQAMRISRLADAEEKPELTVITKSDITGETDSQSEDSKPDDSSSDTGITLALDDTDSASES